MGDHCESTMQKLSGYIDRELDDAEVRKVKEHLDDCPPCEQVFEFKAGMKVKDPLPRFIVSVPLSGLVHSTIVFGSASGS